MIKFHLAGKMIFYYYEMIHLPRELELIVRNGKTYEVHEVEHVFGERCLEDINIHLLPVEIINLTDVKKDLPEESEEDDSGEVKYRLPKRRYR